MTIIYRVVDQIQANHRPVLDNLAQKVQELYIQIIDDYPQLNIIENIEDFVTNQKYAK